MSGPVVLYSQIQREREREQKTNGLKGNWVYKMHHASGAEFINTLAEVHTHTHTPTH